MANNADNDMSGAAEAHGYYPHRQTNDRSTTVYQHPSGHEVAISDRGWTHRDDKRVERKQGTGATELSVHLRSVHGAPPAKPRYWESEMNTRRADSLIRRALSEGGSGTLFQAEPAGGGPTPVTGKMQSGGTLLPAYNQNGQGTVQQNIQGFQSAEMKNGLDRLKKAQDQYDASPAGKAERSRPPGAPMNYNSWYGGKAPMTGADSKFGDGSAYGRPSDGSAPARAPGGGSSMGVARPPSGTVQGTYPSAPRGGGRSNVGSMSRSEHVEVGGGGGSTAPAGRGRGASRITERRTASVVYRAIDEGNPYTTQPGNTPVGGGGGGAPAAPSGGSGGGGGWGQIKPEGATKTDGGGSGGGGSWGPIKPEGATKTTAGPFGGGGPTAPRPGNTGSMGSGGGGGVGGVLSQVGGAVLSTAGRAVGQAIQGNGKVDYSGMARNVGGYAAGTAVNGIAKSVMGGSSR